MLCVGNPDEAFVLHRSAQKLYEEVSQNVALELVSDSVPGKVCAPDDGVVLIVAVPSTEVLKQPYHTPSYGDDMKSFLEQLTWLGVGNRDLFGLDQAITFDARSIPMCNDVTYSSISLTEDSRPLPSRITNYSSSFEMLLYNGVAAATNDSTEAVRQPDQTQFSIYLDETRQYRFHEDEHGKYLVQCNEFLNRWKTIYVVKHKCCLESKFTTAGVGVFFANQLLKVQDMYSLYLDGDGGWRRTTLRPDAV